MGLFWVVSFFEGEDYDGRVGDLGVGAGKGFLSSICCQSSVEDR